MEAIANPNPLPYLFICEFKYHLGVKANANLKSLLPSHFIPLYGIDLLFCITTCDFPSL